MKRFFRFCVFIALAGVCTSAASADLVLDTPSGLHGGDHFRFIFGTGSSTTATSSDINSYDTFVQESVSPLHGTVTYGESPITDWLAVGSTPTVNAKDHLGGYSSSGGKSGTGATFMPRARCTRSRRPFPSTALDAQTSGDLSQAGIPRPHQVAFGNSRIQEMGIDQPNATAVKMPLVDEVKDFFMRGLAGPRQSGEEFEHLMPFGKGSAGEFTDYERVADHVAGFQPDRQVAVAPP